MPRYDPAGESDPLLGDRRPPPPSYSERPFKRRPQKAGPHCCTVCCTFLSVASTMLMIFVGIYATLGWHYFQNAWRPDQVSTVQKNSFGAAGMWAVTGAISMWFWRRSQQRMDIYDREVSIHRPHGD